MVANSHRTAYMVDMNGAETYDEDVNDQPVDYSKKYVEILNDTKTYCIIEGVFDTNEKDVHVLEKDMLNMKINSPENNVKEEQVSDGDEDDEDMLAACINMYKYLEPFLYNINGRHGAFSRSHSQNAHASSQASSIPKTIPFYSDNTLSMAAFRDQPLRGNANTNRQRQLESLRRMEEKIRNKKTQLTKVSKKAENTLSIFVLDITNVLSDDCNALWIPLKQNDHSGPDERILYSLVVGRGELIVFGGIRKEHTTLGHTEVDDSVVYNDLHFINPPRYVI